jgi:acetylornithine deacetylase/succinyl-diaminopimelate desuccinylase-like protein
MEKKWGNDSFAFLIDEGFSGLSNDYGAFVLSMGMAEKGSVDVGIKVENPGGHSSVPPEHTGSESSTKIHLQHPTLMTQLESCPRSSRISKTILSCRL